MHEITKGAQSHTVNKEMELTLNKKFIEYRIVAQNNESIHVYQ